MYRFKKKITLITLFFIISICSFSQKTFTNTINYQGIERGYIIHIPNSYTDKSEVPLILCFHGYSSSANIIMSYSGFNELSEKEGFIVVYPQGAIYKKSGKTHWNVGYTLESKIDDIEFTNILLDNLFVKYRINKDRVYSTGFSNGGYMSFLLACQLSNRFAAVSSVAGSMTPETFEECNPQHPTPILQVHGLEDRVVPYIGKSSWTKPIKEVMNYWSKLNKCDTTITTSFPDIVKEDNSYVAMETHINRSNRISTQHIKIIKGGHEWPGIKESFNINQDKETYTFFSKYNIRGNMDVNISAEIWKFFNQYDINGKIDNQQ